MKALAELHTDRLWLRRWRDADREPFAQLNSDSSVMEFFPAPLSPSESDELVERIEGSFEMRGFGLWAVEVTATATFVGFAGLWPAIFDAPFTPAIEVGWRLGRAHRGRGYATEAAWTAMIDGFERLAIEEIVSFTACSNRRSRRVMEKLAMTHDPADDFDHPALPPGHPLRRHVLYRLGRDDRSEGRLG